MVAAVLITATVVGAGIVAYFNRDAGMPGTPGDNRESIAQDNDEREELSDYAERALAEDDTDDIDPTEMSRAMEAYSEFFRNHVNNVLVKYTRDNDTNRIDCEYLHIKGGGEGSAPSYVLSKESGEVTGSKKEYIVYLRKGHFTKLIQHIVAENQKMHNHCNAIYSRITKRFTFLQIFDISKPIFDLSKNNPCFSLLNPLELGHQQHK